MLAKRSTAFVKLSMVLSASPCSMPSRTQWLRCPPAPPVPPCCQGALGGVDLHQHVLTGHVLIHHLVDAPNCPMIFFSLRWRLSASIHCLNGFTHFLCYDTSFSPACKGKAGPARQGAPVPAGESSAPLLKAGAAVAAVDGDLPLPPGTRRYCPQLGHLK